MWWREVEWCRVGWWLGVHTEVFPANIVHYSSNVRYSPAIVFGYIFFAPSNCMSLQLLPNGNPEVISLENKKTA